MTTAPKPKLLALAERVEQATGPDREIDCLIWCALNGYTEITYPEKAQDFSLSGRVEGKSPDGKWKLLGWIDPGKVQRNWSSYGGADAYPAYTASLDVAEKLVPEGWYWMAGNRDRLTPLGLQVKAILSSGEVA